MSFYYVHHVHVTNNLIIKINYYTILEPCYVRGLLDVVKLRYMRPQNRLLKFSVINTQTNVVVYVLIEWW